MNTDTLRRLLILRQTPRLGVKTLQQLFEHPAFDSNGCDTKGGIEQLFTASATELAQFKLNAVQIKALTQPDETLIEQVIRWAEPADHHIIDYFGINSANSFYPQYLKHTASAPLMLFIKGDPSLLERPQLAIVGSRNLTITGQENAFAFAKQIAELGIVITSGLALGVDGFCHRGALAANGKTIAVLGTGLNQIYPKRHLQLAGEIAQTGTLVSEFLPEQTVRAENFPRRNRIISGLSQGTLVVEAALKSGSLITARYAMEQGREVFAIPGSIHSPMSKGCHALIKQGAKLVENIADIVEDVPLFQSFLTHPIQSVNSTVSQVPESPLLAHIGYDITAVDILAQRSQLPVNEVLSQLLALEMQGDIAAQPGGYIRILRS